MENARNGNIVRKYWKIWVWIWVSGNQSHNSEFNTHNKCNLYFWNQTLKPTLLVLKTTNPNRDSSHVLAFVNFRRYRLRTTRSWRVHFRSRSVTSLSLFGSWWWAQILYVFFPIRSVASRTSKKYTWAPSRVNWSGVTFRTVIGFIVCRRTLVLSSISVTRISTRIRSVSCPSTLGSFSTWSGLIWVSCKL